MKKIFLIAFTFISLASFGQKMKYGLYRIDSLRGSIPAITGDTTTYKPVIMGSDGRYKKMDRWPSSTSGVTTMAAVGSSPNANGASISGNTLTMQPASASQPGVVSTAQQTFAGPKLFSGGVQIQGTLGTPVGTGLEMAYTGSVGLIQVYNRTGSAYLPINLSGLTINLQVEGTTKLETHSSGIRIPASGYVNLGATAGSSGYGFRDNSGAMEYKNSGGAWTAFGTYARTTVPNSSNYTATGYGVYKLQDLASTNRTFTLPSPVDGKVLIIIVENTDATYDWTWSGNIVEPDGNGASSGTLLKGTAYTLIGETGTAWFIISKYTTP